MKKLFYAMLCALVLTACAKSEGALSPEESGRKAYLSLSIDVPVPNRVETRAISELESVVNELMLIMFDGSTKQVVNLTDSTTLISGTTDVANGYRTYTLAEAVPVASGNWNVYAVANWSSLFSNLTAEQLAAMSEAELKQTQMFNNEQYFQSGSRSLPMSSYAPGVVIYPADDAANSTSFKLSLRRAVSRVEFKFQNGTTSNNPNFQPETYAVYNLPKTAGLMHNIAGLSDVDLVQSTEYFNITNQSVPGSGVIEFMMLENVKTAKQTTGGDYKKRDKVNEAKTAFVYAPEHATFLRISGAYEDNDYRGTISFLIHLGDFGSSSSTDATKMDNFAVNRNEHHIYTVTINGVSDLIVEAQKGDETPGVSGEITSKGSNLFVLDAHYETVMVKIPKSHIDGTHTYEQDGRTVTMTNEVQIFSPKHPDGVTISLSGDTAPEGDYGWIQFQKPENTTSFPIYGATPYGTIYDLCKNPATYALLVNEGGTDYYYSVAFVDEFFYEDLPLSDFINVTNRVFILNPHPIHTSLDGESIFKADCTMQLNQRSIKSTYVLNDSSINPFGIETWDETGELEYGVATNIDHGGTRVDGWANTNDFRQVITINAANSSLTSAGYLKSVTDNSKSSHIWTNATYFDNAMLAVYARNRDVDGSGVIEADELKWYLPAVQQYLVLWLGQDLLYEDTKLITGEEVAAMSLDEAEYGSKFFTSSGNQAERIYWQDQGAIWGSENWRANQRTKNNVRCIRNLGAQGAATHGNNASVYQANPTFPATISTNSAGNYVISVSGVQNVRLTYYDGYYPVHHEREDYNLLPLSFEVAPVNDGYFNSSVYVKSYATQADVIDAYNEAADTFNNDVSNTGTKWRVPNQRELMLMALLDGPFPYSTNVTGQPGFACSTFYSNSDVYSAAIYTFHYFCQSGLYPYLRYGSFDYASLRFVRDVAVEQASSSVEEGEMPNGGTGFGIE